MRSLGLDPDAIWPLVGLVIKSCLTLCDSLDVAHLAPLSLEFSSQEYISCSKGYSWPRDQPRVSFIAGSLLYYCRLGERSCCWKNHHLLFAYHLRKGDSLLTELAGKPKCDPCPYKKWVMKTDTYIEGMSCEHESRGGAWCYYKSGMPKMASSRRGWKLSLLHSPWKQPNLQTPCPWTSSLQNRETVISVA